MSLAIDRSFHLTNIPGHTGGFRIALHAGPDPVPAIERVPIGRIPRIAKLMALAIRCDRLIRSGAVPDAATMARLAHVTQPRMTQILNLTLLASDIQETLLFLEPVQEGKPELSEKVLRKIAGLTSWAKQREGMRKLVGPVEHEIVEKQPG